MYTFRLEVRRKYKKRRNYHGEMWEPTNVVIKLQQKRCQWRDLNTLASKRPKCIVIKDINVFWQWRYGNVLSPEMMQIQWYLWNLNTLSSENSNCFWQWRDGKALASKRFENILTKWWNDMSSKNSNPITLKEFNCFIVAEISTDISIMLKKFP